jgi:hypothetical protein
MNQAVRHSGSRQGACHDRYPAQSQEGRHKGGDDDREPRNTVPQPGPVAAVAGYYPARGEPAREADGGGDRDHRGTLPAESGAPRTLVDHDADEAPAPVGANLYQLMQRGRDLQDVVHALSRWGLPLMPTGAQDEDAVQPQWTALYAGLELSPAVSEDEHVVVGVETGGEAVSLMLHRDSFEVRRGLASEVDVTVSGPAMPVGGVLTGLLSATQGAELGAVITGDDSVLTDLLGRAAGSGEEAAARS